MKTYTIKNVPLIKNGTYELVQSDGTKKTVTYTEQDLKDIEQNTNSLLTSGTHNPPLKLGHNEEQPMMQGGLDGLPALGWIEKVYVVGNQLFGDLANVPKLVNDLIQNRAYRKISSEISSVMSLGDGTKINKVLRAVALLGADIPVIKGMGDIINLYSEQLKFGKSEYLCFAESELQEVNSMPDNQTDIITLAELEKILPCCVDKVKAILAERKMDTLTKLQLAELIQSGVLKQAEVIPADTKIKYEDNPETITKIINKISEVLLVDKTITLVEGQGNNEALISWVGKVGFDACMNSKSIQETTDNPEKLCGWLKAQAKEKGVLAPEHMSEKERQDLELVQKAKKDKEINDAKLAEIETQRIKLAEQERNLFADKMKQLIEANRNIILPAFDKDLNALINCENQIIKLSETTQTNSREILYNFVKSIVDNKGIVFGEMLKSGESKDSTDGVGDKFSEPEKKGDTKTMERLTAEELKKETDKLSERYKQDKSTRDAVVDNVEVAVLAEKIMETDKCDLRTATIRASKIVNQ